MYRPIVIFFTTTFVTLVIKS